MEAARLRENVHRKSLDYSKNPGCRSSRESRISTASGKEAGRHIPEGINPIVKDPFLKGSRGFFFSSGFLLGFVKSDKWEELYKSHFSFGD